jgi:hypothetical protein
MINTLTGIDDVENTPDAVTNKAVGKFEPKVLVWCAISEAGVSTPFIGTVDADVYISKCLPKIVKYIEKLYKNVESIFWLDLASCHYAKKRWNGWSRKTSK